MHVARSERTGACEEWHEAQLALCAATEWRPSSVGLAWQVVQAGGVVTPFGPCGVWHEAQPPGSAPCCSFGLSAWQLAHAACVPSEPEWASWHCVHALWPRGALAVSCAWHVAHAGFFTGVCAAPWHAPHSACPGRAATAAVFAAWQEAHSAASSAFAAGAGMPCAGRPAAS